MTRDHLEGHRLGQRGNADGLFCEDFAGSAAGAEINCRAQNRIGGCSNRQLAGVLIFSHFLNKNAVKARHGSKFGKFGANFGKAFGHGRLRKHVEQNAADIGFMRNAVGRELEHDGKADAAGGGYGFLARRGKRRRQRANAEGRKQLHGLLVVQNVFAFGAGVGNDNARDLQVCARELACFSRSGMPLLLESVALDEVGKGARG